MTGAAGGNTNYYLSVYGGGGTGSGKDHVTGNLLQVKGKGNEVYNVGNFEKMKFVLDTTVAAGNTMLRGINTVQAFDWDKVSVGNASTWGTGSAGSKRIVLYTGSTLTLNNYGTSSSNGVSGNFEYGITTNTSTPGAVGTVNATEIYFDRNQFQNAKVTYDTKPSSPALPAPSVLYGAGIYAGTSTLGNTTKNNILTVDGRNINGRTLYGGYTQSTSGDSTGNEVILKDTMANGSHATIYGGWSEKNNATGNTVTLAGAAGGSANYFLSVYGGGGNGSGKDHVTGNLLQVKGKGNEVYNVRNFEKMKFVLDSNIASGDTMLRGINTTQNFDWNKIAVKGITSWAPALSAHGVNIPTLTLYTGAGFTLTNYAPTLVGTAGDYEFGKKANVTGTGTVSASVLTLDGNRFQNATETPTTSSATDIHAGISIYGNTTNHNTLNLKKNGSTPLSFTTVRAGYTKALNGGSDFNTLNLLDGASVTTGYAGYTEGRNLLLHPTDENDPTAVDTTKNADAKNNTVNIQGGTLNAGGKLYGGYIATNAALTPPNNVSAGNASGNTINIESGTFGGSNEIYGGYTNGTGKATGNTINLGKSDGSLTSTTLNNAFLYGGASSGSASDVMTDNTLNVNTQNITVRGVQNFGKTKFNLNSTTTVGNTLLTVGGGATTGLDWAGAEVNPGSFTFTPSTYNARLFTAMHNAAGISFSNYAPYGAKEKIVGDLEYSLDTDNHTGNAAQDVFINGFRFRNHTATYNETPAHDEAWAGRTASGQTVTDNKLIVAGGTLNTAAYGGLVENKKHKTDGTFQDAGDAKKNKLEVAGGMVANAYGAKVMTAAGEAEENSVKITGGTVNNAYGVDLAQATNTKNASKNKAEVANGSLSGSLYGAHTAGSGSLSGSEVKVSGGTIAGSVYGSDVAAGAGSATGSKITLTGGTITGSVYGGKTAGTGAATGHTLSLNGGTVGGNVYGGFTASGATTDNTVNLGSGTTNAVTTITGTIYGGSGATDTDNVLNVNTNAQAGNIANFSMVNFNFNATFNQANPMLNLVGGSVTNFDWSKFKHTGNAPSGQSVLLQNMTGISVGHYTGAKEISSTGTHEYTIDTDTNTATAKQILYGGYQFKDANTTPTTGNALADIWAGRSVIGNTTTNNVLTINGTTHRDAYGGWTAGRGTTAAAKNDSTNNTVNLKAGTVRTIYGGFTSVLTGSATGNEVNISGGSVTGAGYGKVYGGYLSHTSATGNATSNTVTITGGSMTDVYGGFTAGTGATTGNTVKLGDGEHSLAAGTNITGTIHGGNKADATDNTLNINTNAQAGNIKNFDHLNFNLNSHALTQSMPVLRLNSGATGNLDWRKLDVNAEKFNAPIKTYEAYNLVLMENANGISFQQGATNTYTAAGGVKSTTSGDFEFTIDTANHTASSTQVTAAGFKFKNHAATYNEISAHNEAWAGRTNIGNKVEKNTLTVSGGTITTAAYGGLVINNKPAATTGDAEKNAVNITGGTVANAYGAQVRTKAGSASENSAKISGGTVSHVYGASLTVAGATGSVTKNRVDVTGGAVTGDVYGGQIVDTGATGSVTESRVDITGGSVGGSVYGGRTNGSGFAKDNTVNITGGTLHDVYGSFAQAGKATGNTVNLGTATNAVAAGTSVGTIWGSNSGSAGNTLNVNSRQANAADVKNFENVNFDAAHNVSHGDTLLRLTNGANTSIDWSKMKLKNIDAVTASPTTNHILTLADSVNDITFTNYDAARARETKRDGDYEYVLNTDNETATAKKVEVIGYRFANNHPVYSTGANTEAWGGRTKVGNKVEKNSLKVMGGSLTTAAYGGLVQNLEAGSGAGGYKTNGDAAENTLELHAGATIADGYGADVRTQAGNATGNTVDLKGAAVTGNLYAGALTHASASGAATGNKVNLYSGTVAGDVYAGFAAGSGTTTGNTVTIGDGTHDALVHVTGKLYGGNKSAADNALDIKSKGAAVGSLAGFSKIKFNLGSSVADGDTVLTLNENTTLDYSTVEKPTGGSVSAWLGNVMQKKAHLFQMAAGKTLTLNGYAPATGSERAGDVEYSLVTDNNAAATTSGSLDLSAYKWQNADVKITSAVPDAFGGKTVYGTSGETKNNKLTLKTGAAVTNAIAGDTQTANGTAEGNSLTVEAGTATNALGAKTKAGKAVKNKAVLQGGSVTNLKGAESTNGEAEENTAILQGGTAADIVGAQAAGDATMNKAVIKAGTVTGSLKGAKSSAKANKNTVEIEGGNVSGVKIMGAEAKGAAEENVVTIKAAASSNASTEITGAHSTHGNAAKNIVNVNAAVSGSLVGGSAGVGDATDNVLNINANVTGDVYGARAHHASLRNTVNIKDGVTVTGNVTGGACLNANENTINIGRGSTVTGNVIGGNGSVENKNNIINLKGGTVTGDIIGGAGASADNNTLAVYHDEANTSQAHDFDKIKNLHFYLGESIANENPTLLQLGVANKDIRGVDVGVGVMGLAHGLKVNDVISLMKVNGGTLTTDADGVVPPAPATLINHVEAMHGVSLLYGFDLMKRGSGELIATVTKAAISDQAKSFVETRAGMTDFINRGADLLTTSGMSAIRQGAESDKEKGKYDLWAVMSRSSMSVESGSQIDTTGWNLSLGWAKELRKKDAAIVVSPFIEYGKGSYDSHLDDGTHGSGKLSYLGAGVLARMEKEDGLWLQGALHAGRAKSDYTGSISAGTVSNYDSSDTYVAAELSVGKTMKLKGGDKLDTSLRYLWSYQSGGDVAIKTGKYNDVYDFAAVNSHRLRLGTRYSHKESEGNELYAGLYWEYEFSGKACASFMGYEAPSPSLRGGSALLELGWRFQPKDSRVSYDLNLSGWQGKREGVTGSAHVNWAF
ncbi:autotransporter outer membrane beta-barrel domain-containing protein [Selenomonas sp. CM52]|uniref:autotransporter outer membrane beta-barrel domain-containing protein n=1 Tax=Selenomonas sp. CM52 TaxID=936381 RepID=UPI00030D9469|nr:autotransporter outer membrane beta-barrel domain-containing protein [Selenomonas sp. CM52]